MFGNSYQHKQDDHWPLDNLIINLLKLTGFEISSLAAIGTYFTKNFPQSNSYKLLKSLIQSRLYDKLIIATVQYMTMQLSFCTVNILFTGLQGAWRKSYINNKSVKNQGYQIAERCHDNWWENCHTNIFVVAHG
jgi:hypothetical protein